jgi:hypothetical protein
MTAAPMPAARPISANSSSVEIPAWNGESTQLVKWMLQPILERSSWDFSVDRCGPGTRAGCTRHQLRRLYRGRLQTQTVAVCAGTGASPGRPFGPGETACGEDD